MQRVLIPLVAMAALSAPALAQQQPDNSRPANLNSAPSNQEKSGTAPGGSGATAWSGPWNKKQEGSESKNPDATGSDLASGLDLKGPPQHVEGSATPE